MEREIYRHQTGSRRIEQWLLAAALVSAFVVVALWWSISHLEDTSFSHDPRFVVSSAPSISFPASQATLAQRITIWWTRLNHGFQKPRPFAGSITFPASPTNRCLIGAMLNQCTEVNGVRYVILRDVAGGNVPFGHTNSLTGMQWVAAFTEALQHGQPEFFDPQTKAFRRENLVLVTNTTQTVLVLPKAMAAEFQNRPAN